MRPYLLGLALLSSVASANVHYKLTPQPTSKSLLISVTVDSPKAVETFRIPGWSPGYYQMATYQKKLFDIKATDDMGHPLQMEVFDSRTWRVYGGGRKEVVMSYKVLGDDPGLGFFAVNVASDKAYMNGPAAFMYIDGRTKEAVDLQIKNPEGWDTATAMTPGDGGKYVADGYDEFIDHPIQLGVFERKNFEVSGVPFEAIYVTPNNKPKCDLDAETERLRLVSAPALKMFGGASFKKYFYIIHLEVGNFAGGLEHRACNVQAVANTEMLHLDDLAAHEYCHAWNVKQIRPKILGPFDYTKPQRTGNLWFAEGVTDYYSKLHTFQSGLKTEAWLKNELADQARQLQAGQTRKVKTVEDASRGTWESDGFGVGDLSFYTKGLLAGFLFDAVIIDATNGKKTLDDVMRLLYANCKLPRPGYGEDDLRLAINEVAGKDLSDLYTSLIRSVEEMPFDLVGKIGLRLKTTQQSDGGPKVSEAAGYSLDSDPGATPQAKKMYAVWLHRSNSVE